MNCPDRPNDSSAVKLARLLCPVQDETESVLERSKDLRRAVRRLKNSMGACRHCAARQDCPVLTNFHLAVNQAIGEFIEELGLEV